VVGGDQLHSQILQRAGATRVSRAAFLIPVSVIALGVLAPGERLAALQLAGMALITAGVLAIDGRIGAATRR
jgi:drug/metabolite transporter (DMT)-like permease